MDCKHLSVLILVTVTYMIIGMLIFRCLELDHERLRRSKLREDFNTFIADHTCIEMGDLIYLLDLVDDRLAEAMAVAANVTDSDWWDYRGAMSFVTTILTTIGYGHLAPSTVQGKVVSVIYALFGIPLTLIMLKDIGEKLHGVAQRLYNVRFCESPWLNNTISVSIVIFIGTTLVMVLPSLLFVHVEGWTMVEALYYCFITLSTIGFGDYLPTGRLEMETYYRRLYTVFIYIWIFVGLAHVSLVITSISNSIVKKAVSVEKHTLTKLEAEMRRLRLETLRYKHRTHDITTDNVEGPASSTSLDVTLLNYHLLRGDINHHDLMRRNDHDPDPLRERNKNLAEGDRKKDSERTQS